MIRWLVLFTFLFTFVLPHVEADHSSLESMQQAKISSSQVAAQEQNHDDCSSSDECFIHCYCHHITPIEVSLVCLQIPYQLISSRFPPFYNFYLGTGPAPLLRPPLNS